MKKIKSFLTSNEYKNCYVIAFIIAFLICIGWKFKYSSLQQENDRLNTEIEKIIEMYKVEDDKTIRLDSLSIENFILKNRCKFLEETFDLLQKENLRLKDERSKMRNEQMKLMEVTEDLMKENVNLHRKALFHSIFN
jgi:hypothetical protein